MKSNLKGCCKGFLSYYQYDILDNFSFISTILFTTYMHILIQSTFVSLLYSKSIILCIDIKPRGNPFRVQPFEEHELHLPIAVL